MPKLATFDFCIVDMYPLSVMMIYPLNSLNRLNIVHSPYLQRVFVHHSSASIHLTRVILALLTGASGTGLSSSVHTNILTSNSPDLSNMNDEEGLIVSPVEIA